MASKARSKVLQDDRLIYQLTESIDSVKHYFPLGRDLLGSQAAVSNIIGRTEPDFQEIVFKCLYTWRNANGRGAGAKLVDIFRGVELDKVAASLERDLQRRPNCLSEDVYLQSLASKLDCAAVYRKLGLPLLENNSVKFSNLIGPVNIPFAQYQDALFHVLIRWRNQAGSSIASMEDLKQAFLRHGLIDTAQKLHRLEYGSNASKQPSQISLDGQSEITGIIGWTERDYRYQNIVSECLKTWRNANGKAAGTKLVEIFRGLELDKVATYLEQELKRRPNCLIEDTFLQSLASQLDCTLVYRKLGLPLLENNDMKFNDLIRLSNIQTTQHHKDLLHVLHAWIIQVGKSRESLEELKKILLKHGLKDTAQQLHFMEYGPNAGPMDIPRGTEEMETVGLSSTPLPQKVFYDIYLLSSSKKTSYFLKMKNLIQRNEWKMTSPFDSKLGEPVLKSIEKDLSNCSHVVYLITEEDCVKENVDITMTIEIALKSVTHKGLGGRVIPVFCCDISIVPPLLSRLTGENIDDEALEGRLSRSIDVDIRKKREKEYRSVSVLVSRI
eukprot:XP_011672607.1 PREDICTED: uncharacterized protein LOC100891758 [Strongylocentrotus purpuratus]